MPINLLGLGGGSGSVWFILGGGIGGIDLLINILRGGGVGFTPPLLLSLLLLIYLKLTKS